MAFFGQPGFSVGPYNYPAQPGVFDRILQVADLGTNLLGLYQKFKDRSLKDVVNKIAVGRELYGDQPLPIDEGLGQKIEKTTGFTLPRITEQDRQQNLAQLIGSGAGTVMSSQGSPMTDPTILQDKLPTAGQFKPLPAPGPKSLEELYVKALSGRQTALPLEKIQSIYQAVKGKEPRLYKGPGGLYNSKGEKVSEFPEETTTIITEKGPVEVKGKGSSIKFDPFSLEGVRERNRRNRPTGLYQTDPRGFVFKVGDIEGQNKIINPGGTGGKNFVTDDEIRANPGKVWPKGTVRIPSNDPAYIQAQQQAMRLLEKDLDFKYLPETEKTTKLKEKAKELYGGSLEAQGKGPGKAPSGAGAPQPNLSKDEIEALYQKGLAEGRDPELMKARRDELLGGTK